MPSPSLRKKAAMLLQKSKQQATADTKYGLKFDSGVTPVVESPVVQIEEPKAPAETKMKKKKEKATEESTEKVIDPVVEQVSTEVNTDKT